MRAAADPIRARRTDDGGRLPTHPGERAARTKLLASAAKLAERLRERGRGLTKPAGGAEGEVYAAAAQLHYDAETGTFWDEGGGQGADADGGDDGAPVAGGGGGGGGARPQKGGGPPSAARQRARNEANKARVGNHSRKQGAARKQARGAFMQ